MTKGKLEEIPRSKIKRDKRLQMRKTLRPETVERYGELIGEGVSMPPAVVFHDGKTYWLADGWHRDAGCEKANCEALYCEVREGGFREAWLFALGANGDNGLPRDADAIANVMTQALKDKELKSWSDRRLAIHCNVSHVTVGKWRKKLVKPSKPGGNPLPPDTTSETRVGADGKTYTVNGHPAPPETPSEPQWVPTDDDGPVLTEDDWQEAEQENAGKKKAAAYLKGAEKALGALQTNVAEAKLAGVRMPSIEGAAKVIYDAIQTGKRSL